MKAAWTIQTYVRSELPLTAKVPKVMSFTFVVLQDERPEDETIAALVSTHVRNVELLFSEVEFTPLPDELFTDL